MRKLTNLDTVALGESLKVETIIDSTEIEFDDLRILEKTKGPDDINWAGPAIDPGKP